MSVKRHRNSHTSETSYSPQRRVKKPKKTPRNMRTEGSPPTALWRKVGGCLSGLLGYVSKTTQSEDPLSPLPRRLINGHASNSSREISADEENGETSSLAILTNFDRNRRSASGGSSRPIDLTADDDAPGASRPRRPTPPPNGSIYPSLPPERLFDEGALNPDSPSSAYSSNGTVDSQQSEDHEPELPETSETEESPENPLSPTPPPQSYPVRRKPSRPDVRLDPSSRDYSWLRISPGSTSSRSSGSSKRSSSKFHSSPSTNLRSSKQRRQLQSRAEDRQRLMKLKNLVGKTGERGEVGQRVMEMFRPTRISAPSRIEERLFQRRFRKSGDSFIAFRDLLSVKKTLDARVAHPSPEVERFQPALKHRASASAKELAKTRRDPSIAKILESIQLEVRRDEEEIKKRFTPKIPKKLKFGEADQVEQALDDRNFKKRCRTQEVTHSSLLRLKPAQWLDDEIMNFYGTMLQHRSEGEMEGLGLDQGSGRRVYYCNSFFYTKLSQQGYEAAKLRRWTKKVDIFDMDVVIFPINIGNAHWTAAAINLAEKRFEYYDSMGDLTDSRRRIFMNLRAYLDAEHRDKKAKPFDFTGWHDAFDVETPQQDNGSDCGVFSCQTLEAIARGRDLVAGEWEFGAENMAYFRNMMIYEIATGNLVKRW